MNGGLGVGAWLALGAAALWGGGDFSGGMGAKQAGGTPGAALRVVLLSHATSFCVLVGIAFVRGNRFPLGMALAWGLLAGVAGGLALVCFYQALARGAMGASAAVSGLLAAAIPALLTLSVDGSPGVRRLAGFALAGVAIWMIAGGPVVPGAGAAGEARGTMGLAAAAGVGFGVYFVALKMAGTAGVVWPMATARMGSLGVCSLILVSRMMTGRVDSGGKNDGTARRLEPMSDPSVGLGARAVGWALSTALLDTSGNLLFLAATRAGRLDVAAVLGSLYPASTIVLAAWVLGERLTARQGWGMATAAVAVGLIAG